MKCPICISEDLTSDTHERRAGNRRVFQCSLGHAFELVSPDRISAWRTDSGVWATIVGEPWQVPEEVVCLMTV